MANHAVFQLTEQAVADGWAGGVARVSDYAEINVAEALHAGGGVITVDLDVADGLATSAVLEVYPALERVQLPGDVPVQADPEGPASVIVAEPPPEAREAADRERRAREAAIEAENAAKVAEQPTPPEPITWRGRGESPTVDGLPLSDPDSDDQTDEDQ